MTENFDTGDLPADYYLQNFHTLASFVEDTYGELLLPAERSWLAAIRTCSSSAQRLYIRLLFRKRAAFRLSRLKYPDISDMALAGQELARASLVVDTAPETLSELLRAFTFPELKQLLEPAPASASTRANYPSERLEQDRAEDYRRLSTADQWLCPKGHEHLSVFSLCFFGNLYQDISEFVRRDIGKLRYEPYLIEPGSRAFQSRQQIDSHLRLYECDILLDACNKREPDQLWAVVNRLPMRLPQDPHLERRLDRLRNRIARCFERINLHQDALELYANTLRAPARERQIRVLISLQRYQEAARLCSTLLAAPQSEAEHQVGLRLASRLNKLAVRDSNSALKSLLNIDSHGVITKRSVFKPAQSKLILQARDARVEKIARDFFARFGECHEVENALMTGVLGLFIWDILFQSVPGVFFNPFQHAPADFHEPGFMTARATAMRSRFADMEQAESFQKRVLDRFSSSYGIANPLVQWNRLNEPLLRLALDRIPCEHWQRIFERMLADTRENCVGLPDLVLFPDTGDYELIEIKGPGDALQQNQRRWLQYFSKTGVPARVVNIAWAKKGSNIEQVHSAKSSGESPV